ncbi:hypothetical protein LZB68_08040, partial [Campylobacter lari]|nr:hypothetical protein [Campylobacter lari]
RYDGPMGKSDRAFVIGGLGLLLAFGWVGAPVVSGMAWAMSILCVITLGRRVRQGLKESAATPQRSHNTPNQYGDCMRQAQEREFHSFDQVPLFYRYWAGTTATPATRAIVLLHRGHEHSGRVTHL